MDTHPNLAKSPYRRYAGENSTVVRYAITHESGGRRCLSLGRQGRWTYATKEEAEQALAGYRQPHGLPRVLNAQQVATLGVDAIECWASHFDPCGNAVLNDDEFYTEG